MGEFSACQNADDSVLAQVHLSHLFAARVIYAFVLNYHLVNYIQRCTPCSREIVIICAILLLYHENIICKQRSQIHSSSQYIVTILPSARGDRFRSEMR